MDAQFLLPDVDDPDHREFWRYCGEGRLAIQACDECGLRRMPPRPMCPHCQSTSVRWEPTDGRGRVWSFIVAHPPLLPAYAELAPYNVIVVELAESPGIRLVGNLVDAPGAPINSVDPDTIRIGEPVRVVFDEVDGVPLPRWIRDVP